MSVFLEWLIFRVIYTLISHLNDPIVLIFPLVTWNSDPAQELCMCLCRKRYVTQLFYLSYFRDTEANTYHSVTIVFPETNLSSILSVCFVAFWVGSKNVDWTVVAEIAISHVSGYFWIRKFFFPDWNVSPSTRSEKSIFAADFHRMRVNGSRIWIMERKSCGLKNIRIIVNGA